MARQPDSRATTDSCAAEVSGLIPACGASFPLFRHGVRHETADGRTQQTRADHREERHHAQRNRSLLTQRHDSKQRQRPDGGGETDQVPSPQAERHIDHRPQREAPHIRRHAERNHAGGRRDGETRLRQGKRQRDRYKTIGDTEGQDQKCKNYRVRLALASHSRSMCGPSSVVIMKTSAPRGRRGTTVQAGLPPERKQASFTEWHTSRGHAKHLSCKRPRALLASAAYAHDGFDGSSGNATHHKQIAFARTTPRCPHS